MFERYSAENTMGEGRVKDAVITIPAFFTDAQREDTLKAAKYAGLNVIKLLNEPTDAAIAYGYEVPTPNKKTILLFDF